MFAWTFTGTSDCLIFIAKEAAANFPHCLGESLWVAAVTHSLDPQAPKVNRL